MKPPLAIQLEGDAERVRRSTHEEIVKLQGIPAAGAQVTLGVELADGVITRVPHKLGRAPTFVTISALRGTLSAGHLKEIRDGIDRTKYVALQASGYGATVTIDLEVR